MRRAGLAMALSCLVTACVDRLPDQDLRIRSAVPVAKMTAADLWQDYQRDRAASDRKYWGKPVEISGNVTAADGSAAAAPALFFAQTEQRGVRARLLDEDAPAILKVATAGQRVTLHCFCEGLQTDLILKSCILK
jgi:putative nucleic acid binding protein